MHEFLANPYLISFWLEHQLNPLRADYNIIFDQHISGPLDCERLSRAIEQLVNDSLLFQCSLVEKNQQLFWHQHNHFTGLQTFDSPDDELAFVSEPFVLEQGPLYRIGLFKVADNHYNLLIVLHHVLIDGTKFTQLLEKLSQYYNNAQQPAQSIQQQKIELIAQQKHYQKKLIACKKHGADNYWQQYLNNAPKTNELPYVRSDNAQKFQYKRFEIVKNKISNSKSSDFNFLLLTWAVTMARYCNQNNVSIRYPRSLNKNGNLNLGAELTSLVVNINLEGAAQFSTVLALHNEHLSALRSNKHCNYADFPINQVVKATGIKNLNIGFAQTQLKNTALHFARCQVLIQNRFDLTSGGSEISLNFQETSSTFEFNLIYRGDFFTQQQINLLIQHYCNLTVSISHTDDLNINYLTTAENALFLSNLPSPQQPPFCFLGAFSDAVTKHPNAIALVHNNHTMTYQTLDHKSNQLAHYLQSHSQPGDIIALCLSPSFEMLIAILGVLKAGCAYLPLEPTYPDQRIALLLQETHSACLLTQTHELDRLQTLTTAPCFALDTKPYQHESMKPLATQPVANDLAYLLYTSGTTGKPKGVMVDHGALAFYLQSFLALISNDQPIIATLSLSYCFDGAIPALLGPLLSGGRLLLTSSFIEHSLTDYIASLQQQQVNFLKATPSILKLLQPHLQHHAQPLTILVGGEALNLAVINQLRKNPKLTLYNQYGPTENIVGSTYYKIDAELKHQLIGRAYPGKRIYILDQHLNPVPKHVIGELYIGGLGIAKGYLNQPDLTAARFITNPFVPDEKMYKTGDLARWDADGNIEFIGRNDTQIKLHGYRIELDEITQQLSQYPAIQHCTVQLRQQANEDHLVGYYVATHTLATHTLRDFLQQHLPHYMVPNHFVQLDLLPLTTNGKLDTHALPQPEFTAAVYVPPRNAIEQQLCAMWQTALTVEQVGIEDDFFSLGGHSLLAIQVSHKMSELIGRDIRVHDVFTYRTLAAILTHANNQAINITPCPDKNAPLSFAQARLYFLQCYAPQSTAYHIPYLWQLADDINLTALEKSVLALVERHTVLRTTITQDESGNVVQHVHTKPLTITRCALNPADIPALNNIPFQLHAEYPLRFTFIETPDNTHYCSLLFHHIAFDGWSAPIFMRELVAFYQHFATNVPLQLAPMPLQYRDFAFWQQQYLTGTVLQAHLAYWQQILHNLTPLALPTDKPRPAQIDHRGATCALTLDKTLSDALAQLAQRLKVTPFTVLLTGLYSLLGHYCQQDDIVIGTPVANRQYHQLQDLIGFFVNTLLLRATLKQETTFEELIHQTEHYVQQAQAHQDLPFEKLLDELQVERHQDKHPLFQVLFAVTQEKELSTTLPWQPATLTNHSTVAKFDLSVTVDVSQPQWRVVFNYACALFEEQTIQHMLNHYLTVLTAITNQPQQTLGNLRLLSETEYDTIVNTWNQTTVPFDRTLTLPQLFARTVARSPNAIALVHDNHTMTYQTLDHKSNQLARYIREEYKLTMKGELPADYLIPLCFEKSFDMLISIIAILKSGAAYVPIEPTWPEKRIEYILKDTQASIVLTQQPFAHYFTSIPCCYSVDSELHHTCSAENLSPIANPKDLAYVIYTSGSTGQPKGVLIEHMSIVNYILIGQNQAGSFIENGNRIFHSSYVFDASVEEIWFTFSQGNKLIIIDQSTLLMADKYSQIIEDEKISQIHCTPAWLEQMQLLPQTTLPPILLGGEKLSSTLAKHYITRTMITNSYGPTETTVAVCSKSYAKNSTIDKITIGRPFQNIHLYVLDKNLNLLPVGIPGELHISGIGLARGYLNNAKLTEEKFICNPFSNEPDYERLYKTGDLVKWLPNSEIEYIGRLDNQVKISGYRIELDEIKSKLLTIDGIKQCCLHINDEQSQKFLIAYVVGNNTLTERKIKQTLLKHLPKYMVPHRIIHITHIPLTIQGKLDTKSLPQLKAQKNAQADSDDERSVKNIIFSVWQEILPIDNISDQDKFFEIGGTSLLAIKLRNLLEQRLKVNIEIADIFQYSSIEEFSQFILENDQATETTSMSPQHNEPQKDIAIIGLATRTSGANNSDEFWQNLCDGVESIIDFTEQELLAEGISSSLLADPNYIKRAGLVKNYKDFDAEFFNITPNEAIATDPQHRHLYECVWEALENAAINPDDCAYKIGVYASQGKSGYYQQHLKPNHQLVDNIGAYQLSLLNDVDFLATKISYKLGLTGPSLTIQTGCSSSLVAVDTAVNHLRAGKCQIAIAGGVRFKGKTGYLYQPNMISSKDGHCRAFDQEASGTISGDAVGVVILKPLALAIQDKDPIYAVIKGSATNNDADRKVAFTAPSVKGQIEVVHDALQDANVNPETVTYVEAHGTGTILGDPIEVSALTAAYRRLTTMQNYCALASLKTNIGHTDAAAGIMGLIKATLALHHQKIPANINFNNPNPEINFANSPFYVNATLQAWPAINGQKRRAAVSSFGIGGTNAHVVLEEAPDLPVTLHDNKLHLLPLSARSEQALIAQQAKIHGYLAAHPLSQLAEVAYTLQQGRKAFDYRSFIVATSTESGLEKLVHWQQPIAKTNSTVKPKVAFMFPGQGSQYINMAKDLYQEYATFTHIVDQCAAQLKAQHAIDLLELLYPTTNPKIASERLKQTQYAQPILFVIEYALARQLMAWGILPDVVIGHSLGEYVAATIAEIFTLEDALHLVTARGQLMQRAPAGKMLTITQCVEDVRCILPEDVCIAAINCPQSCVISGTDASIHSVQTQLALQKIENALLETSHAFHSHMMQDCSHAFREIISKINKSPPKLPIIANVTGDYDEINITEDDYWIKQLLSPVQFKQSINTLLKDDNICCVEVGPGHALSTLVLRNSHANTAPQIISCMHHSKNSAEDGKLKLMQAVGNMWQANININWQSLHYNQTLQKIPLPGYCFQHKEYWLPKKNQASNLHEAISDNYHDYFYRPIWKTAYDTQTDVDLIAAEDEYTLIFTNEASLDILSPLLVMNNKIVILPGNTCTKISKNKYTINYGKKDDFLTLLSSLRSLAIKHIIYAHKSCLLTPPVMTPNSISNLFMELLYLSQAAISCFEQQQLSMTIITHQLYSITGETHHPQLSVVYGPLKVLSQEHPNFSCKLLDITLENNKVASNMMGKITHDLLRQQDTTEIVYRHGQRWQRDFEKIKQLAPPTPKENDPLTYLITGGLGGIGLSYALHISQNKPNATLILLSRRKLKPKAQWTTLANGNDSQATLYADLLTIDNAANALEIYSVDLALPKSCQQTFDHIYNSGTTIDYVIHCAGVAAGGIISNKTAVMVKNTFDPKIAATLNLTKHLKLTTLKHLILCSSLNAVTGGQSQVDYVAANAFLDSFAPYFQNQTGVNTTSINWLRWNTVGMAETTNIPEAMKSKRIKAREYGVEPPIGCAMLDAVIGSNYTQILTSKSTIADHLIKRNESKNIVPHENIASDKTPIIEKLRHIWQEAFGIKKITDTDDFFALGGHSLLAIQVSHKMSELTGITILIADIFKYRTIQQILKNPENECAVKITVYNTTKKIPLSHDQADCWLYAQNWPESIAEHMPHLYQLKSLVRLDSLKAAIVDLVKRHTIFRTTLHADKNGCLYQMIHRKPISIPSLSCTENELATAIADTKNKPFSLSKDYPVRVTLFSTEICQYVLFVMHHSAYDEWSHNVFMRDLHTLYEARINNKSSTALNKLPFQYCDYAQWQREKKHYQKINEAKKFWLEQLLEHQSLKLPIDKPMSCKNELEATYITKTLNESLTTQIIRFCVQNKISLYTFLLSAYYIVLGEFCQQDEILVGTMTANRTYVGMEDQIGLYARPLLQKANLAQSLTFIDLLHVTHAYASQTQIYQYYPIYKLAEDLGLQSNIQKRELYNTTFYFAKEQQNKEISTLLQPVKKGDSKAIAKYQLSLFTSSNDQLITVRLRYQKCVYFKKTMQHLLKRYLEIVQTMLDDPTQKLP